MTAPRTNPARHTVDTGTLWSSVDRLTRDQPHRLHRKDDRQAWTERTVLPSLLTQLEEQVGATTSTDGGAAKSNGSPAPLDIGSASLLHEIDLHTARALIHHGIGVRYLDLALPAPPPPAVTHRPVTDDTGRQLIDPQTAGQLLERTRRAVADTVARTHLGRRPRDLRANLRALAEHLAEGHQPQHVVDSWVNHYRSWVAQVETALALNVDDAITTRPIRGQACPDCLGLAVERIEHDGSTYWDPAIVASLRDGRLLHVTCRVCSTGWWRGEGLDVLGQQVDDAPTQRRGTHQHGPAAPPEWSPERAHLERMLGQTAGWAGGHRDQ
ncbi:hypothetical protein TEK04_19510 [Klenkia sp. LSe6-5]|uniref:DUF7341 domain-containing protein n=1 Tax=Klenkia sesuvii TaxID=3103137 RepID=A0ABU8DYK0_9ACTN